MREMSQYQDMPVGPYRLSKLIGVGPVSRVYLAERQDRPERQVALKLFEAVPLDLLEEKDAALDEVRLLACLEHPSILSTLDDGIFDNMLYLTTPYMEAGSLRQRLTAGAGELLPLKETMALLRQVGEALQFAHTQRIIHANLKPENILFQNDGKVLLTDFLLPSLVKSERAARILSTFAAFYMAPEQFQGMATPLSDQYALACLAYELLTGQPPFEADDFRNLVRKHTSTEPLPPSQLQPRRAQHIDHVLLKALVKRPGGRYPDIQTFLKELSAPPPLVNLASMQEASQAAAQPLITFPDSLPSVAAAPAAAQPLITFPDPLPSVAAAEELPSQISFPPTGEEARPSFAQEPLPAAFPPPGTTSEQKIAQEPTAAEVPTTAFPTPFKQETAQQARTGAAQAAFPTSIAGFEQETAQQARTGAAQAAFPMSIAAFEQETAQQAVPPVPLPAAVVPDPYAAPTITAPPNALHKPFKMGPQVSIVPVLPRHVRLQAPVRPTSRFARQQVWVIAALVTLALLVSISGIAVFFNASANHQQPQVRGQTPTLSSTSASGQPTSQVPTTGAATGTATPSATGTTTPTVTASTPTPASTAARTTPTAVPPTTLSCRVNYKLSSQWANGFIANLTVTNTGNNAIQGWTLIFTFSNGAQISNGWDGRFAQNGSQVSITNAAFNSMLAPGTSATPGFQASSSGQNITPQSFSLNGVACQ